MLELLPTCNQLVDYYENYRKERWPRGRPTRHGNRARTLYNDDTIILLLFDTKKS